MAKDDIVMLAASAPRLALKLFFTYLKYKRKIKKSVKTFKRELIRSGIEKHTAIMLADEFSKYAEIFSISDLGNLGNIGNISGMV